MSVTKEQAAALYAAVFNRAPDQNGLNFWITQDNFAVMSEGFVSHPVFTAQYGELSNEDFVKAIYENVLQGQGDSEGIEFWVNALNNGVSRGEFLAEFIDAALAYAGDDADALLRKAALENKVTVGLYFTEKMGAASNLSPDVDPSSADVVNDPAYKAAAAAIANVTADPATVEAAKAAIDKNVPLDNADIAEAAEAYQTSVDAQEKAKTDKVEAAKELAEKLGISIKDLEDQEIVDAVTEQVGKDVAGATAALKEEIAAGLEVTEQTINTARTKLTAELETAKANVDALKAQNAAAVTLQEKLTAYNSVAKEINTTVVEYNAELSKFNGLNGLQGNTPALSNANDADKFAIEFTVKPEVVEGEGEDAVTTPAKTVTLTVEKGQVVVSSDDADAKKQFNELKGVEAYKAEVLALYGNIAKQAAAQQAVSNAALAALKADGYAAVTSDGKPAAWNLVSVAVDLDTGNATLSFKPPVASIKNGDDTLGETDNLFSLDLIDSTEGLIGDEDADEFYSLVDLPSSIENAANASKALIVQAQLAEDKLKLFEKNVVEYNEALANQKVLDTADTLIKDATKAVTAAKDAFKDLGVTLIQDDNEDGVFEGSIYNEEDAEQLADLFIYTADAYNKATVENFDGKDLFYFGDKAVKLVTLTAEELTDAKNVLGGDNSVLEIFAVQEENGNTTLYVEKQAFAGSSSTEPGLNGDLVKITLTGVTAEDLAFNDGFLHF